ncbi:Dual specificity mitogen-activated protein kinase kinase hemipterous [Gryllus bimaculatus]|nr:Dual specificity mitogen-activated protein kinase kinase hemipterous [Gryllus bimaculatus]
MAEHQGNPSNHINQGSLYNQPLVTNSVEFTLPVAAEKRRALKLSFGSTPSGFPLGGPSTHPIQPFVYTAEDRFSSSPSRTRIPTQRRAYPYEEAEKTRDRFAFGQSTGKLKVSPELVYDFTSDDLQDLGEIGRGAFGTVNKMVHRRSNTVMAVKRIRSTVDEKEQKQLLMDLEVVMKSNECPYIVQFYGALFKETVKALNYLKEQLMIIHRDVKPSNILLDKRGNIKLCDFGISGQLVDSIARTRDAGCRPYMAPERIDPQRARGYDVRSDVWSLGITLMEVATGRFPYPKWNSVFEQLCQVVQGDPPRLSPNENGNHFTMDFVNFVNTCLIKEETQRPKYNKLLEHPFIRRSDEAVVDVAQYVKNILDNMANNGAPMFTTNQP